MPEQGVGGQVAGHDPGQPDGGGHGAERPAGGHQPGELFEDGHAVQREQRAAEDDLDDGEQHQQRHRHLLLAHEGRDQQPEHHGRERQQGDGQGDLEQGREHDAAAAGRVEVDAGQGDQGEDDGLGDRDGAQHHHLGHQVRRSGQADGAFAPVDRALLDEFAHRVGRAGEHAADAEDEQRVHRRVLGQLPAREGPGHGSHHERQGDHDDEEGAVGGEDGRVAADQGAQLGGRAARAERGRGRGRCGLRAPGLGGGLGDVVPVERRVAVFPRPVPVLDVVEGLEGFRPLLEAEEGEGVVGPAVERDPASGGEDQETVADAETEDAVRDHDDGAAVVGEPAQHVHHGAVHAGVETGGRLVQEEQRRLGQQFHGDADPFALAAGESVHGLSGAFFEPQFPDHLLHPGLPFGVLRVLGEAQFGGVGEGGAHGELGVQDVVLRDQADAPPQFGVVAVQVTAVVQDGAVVGGPLSGQSVEQRGLAGPARSDDGEQALLPHREGDVVEQDLVAAVDGDREVLDVEGDLPGVDILLEFVADQAVRDVADADDVSGACGGAGDGTPVEVGAVVAAEVDDLVAAVGAGAQFGVVAGDRQVVDDEVVVGGPADADRARGRAAVGAGQFGTRDGRGMSGGGLGGPGEDGAGPVGGVAEADDAAGADVPRLDATAVGVGAVGALCVFEHPAVVVAAQHRVVPRDPCVVEHDVAQRITPDVVVVARVHHRGARVGLQNEFGRRRGDRSLRHGHNSTDSLTCAPA